MKSFKKAILILIIFLSLKTVPFIIPLEPTVQTFQYNLEPNAGPFGDDDSSTHH